MTTRLYIDTEFTDLLDMDLISVAIVCGEDQFYAERSDYDESLCSAFTREAVLPLLGNVPAMNWEDLKTAAGEWIERYKDSAPILCFDNVIDYALLIELLGECPSWLRTQNIRDRLDPHTLLTYFRENGVKAHHALADALANQRAHEVARKASGLDD